MASYRQIFDVFETMSLSEKRHFELLSRLYSSERHYKVLYVEIKKWVEGKGHAPEAAFDEERFERKLYSLGVPVKRLSDLRAYLYRLLLQSLRMLHQEESQDFVITNLLYEAKLLHRKGLFDAAVDRYTIALKLSREYAYPNLSVEALKGIIIIRSQSDAAGYVTQMEEYLGALQEIAPQQYNETLMFAAHFRSGMAIRTRKNNSVTPDSLREQLLAYLSASEEIASDSFLTRIYRHACRAYWALLDKDWGKAREYFGSIINNDGWSEKRLKEHLRLYIIFLSNYVTYCIKTKTFRDVERHLQELGRITPSGQDDKAEIFQNLVYLQQLYYLNTGALEAASALIPNIEEGLNMYANKINKAREYSLRYNMMLVLFALSDFEEALEQANRIINMKRSRHRQDLQAVAKIFQLIILFEQNNHDYLDVKVRSIVQNLDRTEDLHDFERIVLHHLGKLSKQRYENVAQGAAARKASEAEGFKAFQVALEQWQEKAVESHNRPLGCEEVMIWIKSKLEPGKQFRDFLVS
jgi:hypothetical protein